MRLAFTQVASILWLSLSNAKPTSTPTLLTQFPPSVRIENLTILPNSTLVVCNAFTAELFGIDPLHGVEGATPNFITSLAPYSSAIFGLASPSPDTIAATGSNFSFKTVSLDPGSNVVYTVTLTREGPKTEAFPVPSAAWLNGLTPVPRRPHYLLIADCLAGALLRLDTRTGSVETVSTDPLFAVLGPSELPIGINGVRAIDGWVYFTNTYQGVYGRLAITAEGLAVGTPAEVVAYGINGSTFDDFALSKEGIAYLATADQTNFSFSGIDRVTKGGASKLVAEWPLGSTVISQPVSAVFGQTKSDKGVLYFATAGQYFDVEESLIGGQVFSLDVGC